MLIREVNRFAATISQEQRVLDDILRRVVEQIDSPVRVPHREVDDLRTEVGGDADRLAVAGVEGDIDGERGVADEAEDGGLFVVLVGLEGRRIEANGVAIRILHAGLGAAEHPGGGRIRRDVVLLDDQTRLILVGDAGMAEIAGELVALDAELAVAGDRADEVADPLPGLVAILGDDARAQDVVDEIIVHGGVAGVLDDAPTRPADHGVAGRDRHLRAVLRAGLVKVEGVAALDVAVLVERPALVRAAELIELGVPDLGVRRVHRHDVPADAVRVLARDDHVARRVADIGGEIMAGGRVVVVAQRRVQGDDVAIDRLDGPLFVLELPLTGADDHDLVADIPVGGVALDRDHAVSGPRLLGERQVALLLRAVDLEAALGDDAAAKLVGIGREVDRPVVGDDDLGLDVCTDGLLGGADGQRGVRRGD